MKMYVKPSISVIELQLKENIAAVPTTVYKGTKSSMKLDRYGNEDLTVANTGLQKKLYSDYGISIA